MEQPVPVLRVVTVGVPPARQEIARVADGRPLRGTSGNARLQVTRVGSFLRGGSGSSRGRGGAPRGDRGGAARTRRERASSRASNGYATSVAGREPPERGPRLANGRWRPLSIAPEEPRAAASARPDAKDARVARRVAERERPARVHRVRGAGGFTAARHHDRRAAPLASETARELEGVVEHRARRPSTYVGQRTSARRPRRARGRPRASRRRSPPSGCSRGAAMRRARPRRKAAARSPRPPSSRRPAPDREWGRGRSPGEGRRPRARPTRPTRRDRRRGRRRRSPRASSLRPPRSRNDRPRLRRPRRGETSGRSTNRRRLRRRGRAMPRTSGVPARPLSTRPVHRDPANRGSPTRRSERRTGRDKRSDPLVATESRSEHVARRAAPDRRGN